MLSGRPMLDDFSSDRFRIVRPLGSGGMGVVYEAVDSSSGERVALKRLRRAGGLDLLLLKNEFRALSGLSHPNLVALHELHADGAGAFLTMELVEGQDLIGSLRGPVDRAGSNWVDGQTQTLGLRPDDTLLAPSAPDVPPPESRALPTEALPSLRSSLAQLAEGLATLHGSEHLHRDVKPSNVLVTDDGRAVLLDFGLVSKLATGGAEDGIAGSVPYMSPEQAAGGELGPATDWYALGAMLYEALCGHPPFTGVVAEVFRAKQSARPVPPSDLVDGVPLDLEALCLALLEREPARRPTGVEVLRRLGCEEVAQRIEGAARDGVRLVGRSEALAVLDSAWTDLRAGRPVVVHVRGRSGMGKSSLCHHFLDGLDDALVLRARCYERDSVPFKAIDPLIDQLSRWLAALPTAEAATLLPRYVRSLAQLFGVLRRIPVVADSEQRTAAAADPREERRRAFGALRELLARVAERERVVVYLDDLQWGDQDSGELLRELIRLPDPPSMLLIASFRSENEESSPLLQMLRADADTEGVRTLDIEPLQPAQSLELARQILRSRGVAEDQLDAAAAQIAAEGAGSPFFVTELAHWGGGKGARLDGLVRARASELPEAVGELLRTIALAAVPMARRVVLDAAGVSERRTESLTALESGRFVRSSGPGPDDLVECYHDRIREAVVGGMDEPERRAMHGRIATTLEAAGSEDAELMAEHCLLAGRNEDAARHAELAVQQALAALAFDRGAAMLRLLLELGVPDEATRQARLEQLGRVLHQGGRVLEAADAFDRAASLAQGQARRRLLLDAAQLRLWAGEFDRGRETVLEVLDQVHGRVPRSRLGLLLGGLWARLKTRLRGIGLRERDDEDVRPEEGERIELLMGSGFGALLTDQLLAFYLLAQSIPRALRHGTRRQQVSALAADSFVAQIEPGGQRRSAAAFLAAEALAERIGDSSGLANACLYRGMSLVQLGEFGQGLPMISRAAQLLENQVVGGTANLGWTRMFLVAGLGLSGRIDECVQRFSELIADARDRGDRTLEVHTVLGALVQPRLMRDDPAAAERAIDEALVLWGRSEDEFDLQHFYGVMSRARVLLYRGEGAAAWALIDARRKDIRRSGATRSGANVRHYRVVEAASAIAAAGEGPPAARARLLQRAEKLADRLLADGPAGVAWGGLLGAVSAAALGRPEVARARLDLVEPIARSEDFAVAGAMAKIHRARLFGDAAELDAAHAALGELGIRDPLRWTRSWAPWLEPAEG